MTTTGPAGTDRLSALADQHGIAFLDAPVLGSRKPAEEGTLTVLCSGPSDLRDRVEPALEAMGSKTVWVGERAGQASALKLVCNAWTITLTDATAQSVALAQGLGLDPTSFLDSIRGGGTDNGYVQMKGKAMIEGSTASAAFSLSGARKDMSLIREALAGSGTDTRLADTVLAHFDEADAAGYSEHDNAAVVYVYR
jgi:3-hydroxyisobutyrate dehydrogenase